MMRPRGTPPMPSARSSAIDPVGIESTCILATSPSRMIAPLPNWRSIWASAVSRAFSLSVVFSVGCADAATDVHLSLDIRTNRVYQTHQDRSTTDRGQRLLEQDERLPRRLY